MVKKIYSIIIHLLAIIGFIFIIVYIAIILGMTKNVNIKDLNRVLVENNKEQTIHNEQISWQNTEEYISFKKAVIKDKEKINEASKNVNLSPRLIVSALFVEQMRLYTDNSREFFKKVFEPLAILGIQSQYSWGVMGLKQETAILIENNLKDADSVYYLGKEFENLLDFKTNNVDTERFDRIIDKDNQYYSYLYAGIYMRQIMTQWQKSGFSIENKPEIITTLYNIGFSNSIPKENPMSGGSNVTIGGKTYNFGDLAKSFYESNELIIEFPEH